MAIYRLCLRGGPSENVMVDVEIDDLQPNMVVNIVSPDPYGAHDGTPQPYWLPDSLTLNASQGNNGAIPNTLIGALCLDNEKYKAIYDEVCWETAK
jgi:hypothetical protein